MTPESSVRNLICSWLTLKRIFVFIHDSVGIFDPRTKRFRVNTNPYRKKGVSDVLGVLNDGRFLAIEVKTPEVKDLFGKVRQSKTYPTQEQKAFIEEVRKRGGVAFVARGIEDVERELKEQGVRL